MIVKTEDEDKLIVRFVRKHGEGKSTWEKLAIKLNIKHPNSAYVVERRHDVLVVKDSIVTGPFTAEEDRIIISDVENYGDNLQTFKSLCVKLNRRIIASSIKRRFEWLRDKPSKPPGPWSFCEDQILIQHMFQVSK